MTSHFNTNRPATKGLLRKKTYMVTTQLSTLFERLHIMPALPKARDTSPRALLAEWLLRTTSQDKY
jgi:DNA recombination-dependent growth factor C